MEGGRGGARRRMGQGGAWHHSLPFKVEDSICFELNLEVDSEEEPKTERAGQLRLYRCEVSEGRSKEERGTSRGEAWHHSLPFKVEDSVCFEPHLEVDSEEEPKTGGRHGTTVCPSR